MAETIQLGIKVKVYGTDAVSDIRGLSSGVNVLGDSAKKTATSMEQLSSGWNTFSQQGAEAAQPERIDDDPDTFAVWPENWDTVRVFIALGTQWRREVAGMDAVMVWQGLRYGEADVTIRLMGFARQARAIVEGLRVIESAALPVLNKR